MKLTPEIMYEASVRKDKAYEGVFIMAVKTTGIFCRPSCTARKPKFENVEFFDEAKDAMLYGYRPCKICKPMQQMGDMPQEIKDVLQLFQNNADVKLTDWNLKQKGFDPVALRRWFKRNYNMTFQAYQRFTRINNAIGQIKYGDSITSTAYKNGFESLSGFGQSVKKITGASPAKTKTKQLVTITHLTTPLGPMIAGATDEGICLFDFSERRMMESIMKRIEQRMKSPLIPGHHTYFDILNKQVEEYFNGTRKEFDLPLHLIGSDFQKKVWNALLQIPYGETRSYKQQSIAIDNLKAIRAVGTANGQNAIAIIVPCHRVIGDNGSLVGYGGGLPKKKWLLEHEAKHSGKDMQIGLFEE